MHSTDTYIIKIHVFYRHIYSSDTDIYIYSTDIYMVQKVLYS